MSVETIEQTTLSPEDLDKLDFEQHESYRHTGKVSKPAGEDPPAGDLAGGKPKENSEPAKPEANQEEKPEKKEGGFQRKIRKLEEENLKLQGRLQALEGKPAGEKPKEQPQAPKEPRLDDFETWEQYNEAKLEWLADQKVDKKLAAERETSQKRAQEQAAAEQQKTWKQQVETASAKYDDWDETFENTTSKLTPAMTEALQDSEHGAELAYKLAKDPAESERIAKLSPNAQIREIGKLELKYFPPAGDGKPAGDKGKEPPENKKPKASAAPEPITPVSSSKGPANLNDPDMPFDDWEQVREAQLRKR